jgi:hypothetical protein
MLRWDDLLHATRAVVAEDGAGAVTAIRLADELVVDPESIRLVAVDLAMVVRSAADYDLGLIAAEMMQDGPWLKRLSGGLADSIVIGSHYMSGAPHMAAGFALGPGVIAWIDAVISLLEYAEPDDDEWLYRSYRLLTAICIGSAYTFRRVDGKGIDRNAIADNLASLVVGLPRISTGKRRP